MMYKIQHKSGGSFVDTNNKRFQTKEYALAEAVNCADEFARSFYANKKAGKVGISVGSELDIYVTHEDKAGAWQWRIVEEISMFISIAMFKTDCAKCHKPINEGEEMRTEWYEVETGKIISTNEAAQMHATKFSFREYHAVLCN